MDDLRELALNILADADEHPDPESPSYTISRDYMEQLMCAAGFKNGIEEAESVIDAEACAARERRIQEMMAEGDAGPYAT